MPWRDESRICRVILDHPLEHASAFTAENLIEDLRRIRNVPNGVLSPVCILEFDGDLTDWLVQEGRAMPILGMFSYPDVRGGTRRGHVRGHRDERSVDRMGC